MDKNTALILGVAVVGLFAVMMLGQGQGQGGAPFLGQPGAQNFAGGRIGPDGFPLPEDRVLGVLERLTQLGGSIYDTVQSRRGGGGGGAAGGAAGAAAAIAAGARV